MRVRIGLRTLAASALAGSVAVAAPADSSGAAALPTVDMEATVKAAQIDPRRPDQSITTGAKASVLLVEKALQRKGLLPANYVDGHFGSKTVEAYAAFQRSLGHSGLAANGLPGKGSLTLLGDGNFIVTKAIRPGARTSVRGVQTNTRTASMLAKAEQLTGRTFVISQGSYNNGGDSTSAGTHDGGGALDLDVAGLGTAARTAAVRALRQVGFAAWLRSPTQGDWQWHIHAVASSDTDLSTQAQHQVGDYYLGKNGLKNQRPDDGPQVTRRTWEEYRRSQ